jgi:hypothetical protein
LFDDGGYRLLVLEKEAEVTRSISAGRRARMDAPEKHRLRIALDTFRYADATAAVMGGPSKAEAVRYLLGRGDWPEPRLRRYLTGLGYTAEETAALLEAASNPVLSTAALKLRRTGPGPWPRSTTYVVEADGYALEEVYRVNWYGKSGYTSTGQNFFDTAEDVKRWAVKRQVRREAGEKARAEAKIATGAIRAVRVGDEVTLHLPEGPVTMPIRRFRQSVFDIQDRYGTEVVFTD